MMFRKQSIESLEKIFDVSKLEDINSEEIADFETKKLVTLPAIYKDFMVIAGRDTNKYMYDYGFILYPGVLCYRKNIQEEANDEGFPPLLPDNSVVLKTCQGEYYHFFCCDGNDDPKVKYFEWDEIENPNLRLSEYLLIELEKMFEQDKRIKRFRLFDEIVEFQFSVIDELKLKQAIFDMEKDIEFFQDLESHTKSRLVSILLIYLTKASTDRGCW